MKKLLASVLAAAMSLTLLAACGSNPAASNPNASGSAAPAPDTPASNYPKFAITVNTSKSGSNVDIMARLFAKYANKYSAQSIVVNSMGGQVEAARETLSAEPDGYTLCMTNNTVIINDVVGETEFNSVDDFDMIGIAIDNMANWLCIKTDFAQANGIESLTDLYDYTQEHPGELLISDRIASSTNTVCEQLKKAGFQFSSADAGTSTDRLTNFLTGNVDVGVLSWNIVSQYVENGEVTCLALCNQERSKFTPDIPTTYEMGYEVAAPTYYYLYGPKGMPQDVIDYLSSVMEQVVQDPDFIADCNAAAVEAHPAQSPADVIAKLQADRQEMIDLGMGEGYQG